MFQIARILGLISILVAGGLWGWWNSSAAILRQRTSENKTRFPEVSPEVREKAFGLLNQVLTESESVKYKPTALAIQFTLADLLWEQDEQRARRLFSAVASAAEKEDCLCNIVSMTTIAKRDAKLAWEILEKHGTDFDAYERENVFDYLLAQYPDFAVNVAKREIERGEVVNYLTGIDGNFNGPEFSRSKLQKVYATNQKHGAEVAREILARLRNTKLAVTLSNASTINANYTANAISAVFNSPANSVRSANRSRNEASSTTPNANWIIPLSNINRETNSKPERSILRMDGVDVPFSSGRTLFRFALWANQEAQKNGGTELLSETELEILAVKMVKSLMLAKRFDTWQVRGIYSDLKKYAPKEMLALEKTFTRQRLREISQPQPEFVMPRGSGGVDRHLYNQIPSPPNESVEERKEREFVNDVRYYSQVTSHCNIEDNADRFVRFKNYKKYSDLIEMFKDHLPLAYAKAGMAEELRPALAGMTRTERARLLSIASAAFSQRRDRDRAKELVDEAALLLPKEARNKSDIETMDAYAHAVAMINPEQGFQIAEKMTRTADRLIGFSTIGFNPFSLSYDESFNSARELFARHTEYSIRTIRTLAHVDFERTVKLADLFEDPELRVFFRWYIANALLNKNAESEEEHLAEEICG